ncbi:MAG: FAD-binding protein [Spirochaetes bacterium]|nr:FAD-binding protein [Spirochaetota bacterium]
MKKKITSLSAVLALFAIFNFTACGQSADFTPGTFIGVGPGLYGPIVVEVAMPSANTISAIRVISHDETHNTGNIPLEILPRLIVENQSLQVDLIAGATISSMAFMVAVHDALSTAGASPASFTGPAVQYVPHADTTADVVVIGAGGAGMTAAIHAAMEGSNVILLERLAFVGGTSNYILEGFGSVGSITHSVLGTGVTPAALAQILATNNPNGIPAAFQVLAQNNGWAANWLRSIGSPMTVSSGPAVVQTSREVGEIGVAMVSALRHEALRVGVDLRVNSRATELIMEDGAVAGVRVSTRMGDYTIRAPAVILATGGFAANNALVAQHFPALAGYGSASSPGNTGDGHLMAQAVGALLTNMDHIRVNYTYATAPNGYFYYVASIVNTGGILINGSAQRFMNDQIGFPGGHIARVQEGPLWMVFDNALRDGIREVRRLGDLGMFVTSDTLEGLVQQMGLNQAAFMNTIENYRAFAAAGVDGAFGRPLVNMSFDRPPFHALQVHVRVQGTFGGVNTNLETEVMGTDGNIIPGLFAAGEVADEGTWGQNPAAVNIVFGRIAGLNAAAFAAASN